MHIKVPTQISLYRFIEDIHYIGAAHSDVMLETVFANILHQLLKVIHLGDSDTTVHSVGVVSDLALAEISLDTTFRVVGGDTEEGERTARHLGIDSTEGVDLTQCASQYTEGT